MSRRIVFFGNCQAEALANFYRAHLSQPDDDIKTLYFLSADAGDVNDLRSADIVIEQIFHGPHDIISNNMKDGGIRASFPHAMGAYFWPFASEPHINSQSHDFAPHLLEGPWGAEEGDSHLNRLIARGTPTEDAVESYLAMDIARHANLDRLRELHLSGQRQRDAVAGIDLAGIIERYFCTERLFTSRGHPELRLFTAVAEPLFIKAGLPRILVEEALARLSGSPLLVSDVPMHPGLIAHYRLEWLEPEALYLDRWWGPTSFRQWVQRYMDYDWNPDLHRGIYYSNQPAAGDPLPSLEAGLRHAPQSLFGLRALADVYATRGRFDDAEAALLRAARLDPFHTSSRLAALLVERGKTARAEAILRGLIARFPKRVESYFQLAELLAANGNAAGAADCIRRAASRMPSHRPDEHCTIARHYLRIGEAVLAEEEFRLALAIEPAHRDALWGLAEAFQRQNRIGEALEQLRRVAEIEPDTPDVHRRMAHLLRGLGDTTGVVRSLRAVVAARPDDIGAWEDLAELLGRDPATMDESREILVRLTQPPARNFRAWALLGYLLERLGDNAASEQCFRTAVDIIPHNADATAMLISLLGRQGRIDQIMPVYERFLEVGGTWIVIHTRVGQIMLQHGEPVAAERAFRSALAIDPNHAEAADGLRQARASVIA